MDNEKSFRKQTHCALGTFELKQPVIQTETADQVLTSIGEHQLTLSAYAEAHGQPLKFSNLPVVKCCDTNWVFPIEFLYLQQ